MFKNLDEKFDIDIPSNEASAAPNSTDSPINDLVVVSDTDLQADLELARTTMRTLLKDAAGVAETAMNVARGSEQPRAFEVAAQVIKAVSDAAKDLLELQKKRKDLVDEDSKSPHSIKTQNIFVGSTAELYKAMNKQDKERIIAASASVIENE
jgi:hypothetical protein